MVIGMEELSGNVKRPHKLMLTGRRTCSISGVNDVLAFDNQEILLETEMGMLMIKGGDMRVGRLSLDKGEVDVEGKVDSLIYSEAVGGQGKQDSLFSRLFR